MFRKCLSVRKQKKDEFKPELQYEFLPWTSAPGPQGLRTLLMRQFHLTLEKILVIVDDVVEKKELYSQLVDFADFILGKLDCVKTNQLNFYCNHLI